MPEGAQEAARPLLALQPPTAPSRLRGGKGAPSGRPACLPLGSRASEEGRGRVLRGPQQGLAHPQLAGRGMAWGEARGPLSARPAHSPGRVGGSLCGSRQGLSLPA